MGIDQSVGRGVAKAVLVLAKKSNTKIRLTTDEGDEVDLWVRVLNERLDATQRVRRGLSREVSLLQIILPVQTGFTIMTSNARPIAEGWQFLWPIPTDPDSTEARIFSVVAPVAQRYHGYVYEFTARERKGLDGGARV